MSNVIYVDFVRRRRRRQLTLGAKHATVKGAVPERVSNIAASMDRLNQLMKRIKEESCK